jgi:hypothetical protein
MGICGTKIKSNLNRNYSVKDEEKEDKDENNIRNLIKGAEPIDDPLLDKKEKEIKDKQRNNNNKNNRNCKKNGVLINNNKNQNISKSKIGRRINEK